MTEPAKKVVAKNAATGKTAAAKKVVAKKAPVKNAASARKAAGRNAAPGKTAVAKKAVAKKPASAKKAPVKNGVTARDKADSAAGSKFFKRAIDRARRISDDPDKLREIAEKANRSSALRTGPFAAVLDDFRALIRLVVAYARGHYRQVPIDRLIVVVGGLIYVVSPIDVIPDAVPGVGFLG